MPKGIQYLICNCGTRNKALIHQLNADNWFQERHIDYVQCPKCGKHILQKRFVSVNGEYVNPEPLIGYEKVFSKYQEFLRYKIQTFDNDFLKSLNRSGGLIQGVYYAQDGVQFRTDHIRTGRKWSGDRWLRKINGRYR